MNEWLDGTRKEAERKGEKEGREKEGRKGEKEGGREERGPKVPGKDPKVPVLSSTLSKQDPESREHQLIHNKKIHPGHHCKGAGQGRKRTGGPIFKASYSDS